MRWFLESDKIWDLCYFISNDVNALKNMIPSLIENWKSVFFILFSFLLHIYIFFPGRKESNNHDSLASKIYDEEQLVTRRPLNEFPWKKQKERKYHRQIK